MAASVVSISGSVACTSALKVEWSKLVDRLRGGKVSSSGGRGVLGFIKQRPAPERIAGPSSSVPLAVLSCSSRSSEAAATCLAIRHQSAVRGVDDNEEDDDNPCDEATEFADMEDWMRNKPPGFGVKEYDTSLEDHLLGEIEAEKVAQAAIGLKKKSKKPGKAIAKQDAPPQGVEVYVGNLPRKRNVDRDLRAAFRSAQGLLHIRPIVDSNEKTREPMCKGLAFLTFASDGESKDFIRRYNGENVRFGKTEKKLVCELAVVNSPFKKQVPQKQGGDFPRLQIRDRTPSSPSTPAPPFSHVGVEFADTAVFLAADRDLSGRLSTLDSYNLQGEVEDVDALGVSKDKLHDLQQEIWAELEDGDDFELDRELEEDENEDSNALLTMENVRGSSGRNDIAVDRHELGQVGTFPSDPIHVRKFENDFVVDAKAESSPGRGFGLSPKDTCVGTAGDKDKRIHQLESKLEQLQAQLKERQSKPNSKERTSRSEEDIEALEKRLLARQARSFPEKDSKINTAKRVTGLKNLSSKVKSLSKETPSRPKLGAKRLRKKERQIYTEVLSKYSPSAKEVAA